MVFPLNFYRFDFFFNTYMCRNLYRMTMLVYSIGSMSDLDLSMGDRLSPLTHI